MDQSEVLFTNRLVNFNVELVNFETNFANLGTKFGHFGKSFVKPTVKTALLAHLPHLLAGEQDHRWRQAVHELGWMK
jgi:hypothetical protein